MLHSVSSLPRLAGEGTAEFNEPALVRPQPLYILFRVKQGPVFLINSRQARLSAAPFGFPGVLVHLLGAPLLPKLRGQVAEFLEGG